MKTTRLLSFWLMFMTSVATAQISIAETLVHETIIDAPLKDVWNAFTDADEIETWMVPKADIDLRIGGLMRTTYNPDAALDGPEAIHHRILAYEPQRMIATQVVKCPQGFEFKEQIEQCWQVVTFEQLSPGRTKIRGAGVGYQTGGAWDTMRDYFDLGNAWTYDQLRRKFADDAAHDEQPADEAEQVLALLGRLVGGEWIHESTQQGDVFRVRNVLQHGPDGRSVVGKGWLGNESGMHEHGSTQVYLDPVSQQVRFFNTDENGSVAEGPITLVDERTVEWDWRIRGSNTAYRVLMSFTGEDNYTFKLSQRKDDGTLMELVDIVYDRVDEAPQRFHVAAGREE